LTKAPPPKKADDQQKIQKAAQAKALIEAAMK
jgi:hypothetical protein